VQGVGTLQLMGFGVQLSMGFGGLGYS
jgi:hypothetical protein